MDEDDRVTLPTRRSLGLIAVLRGSRRVINPKGLEQEERLRRRL
jgi:hypothetical protein